MALIGRICRVELLNGGIQRSFVFDFFVPSAAHVFGERHGGRTTLHCKVEYILRYIKHKVLPSYDVQHLKWGYKIL
jgi:hypothetical protein